jgi:hypothetical protein
LTDAAKQQLAATSGGIAAATDSSIIAANKTVAAAFGLPDALAVPVLIKDNSKNTDNSDAGRYALVLATLSASGSANAPAHDIALALARDFADGKLDGKAVDGSAITNVDMAALQASYATKLEAAAVKYAKPEVEAVIKAEVASNLVVLNPAPKAPDANTSGIKAARDVIADVRVSAYVADTQLKAIGKSLGDAVQAVDDNGRMALEHYEVLTKGTEFMRNLRDAVTTGARPNPGGGFIRDFAPSAGRPAMTCVSDKAVASETTTVNCLYGRTQGRNAANPTEWSRFVLVFTLGDNAGEVKWNALGQTATKADFSDRVNVGFGSDTVDGIYTFKFSGDEFNAANPAKLIASIKGDMPFGFPVLNKVNDKHTLDLSAEGSWTESVNGLTGTASLTGSVIRTVGTKTAKLEIRPDSKITVDEAKNSAAAKFGVKATVGDQVLTGSLEMSDTGALYAATPAPATAKFSGSVVGAGGESATLDATLTVSKLDTVGDLHAGTVSLAAKVTTKEKVAVQLALGMERPTAGTDAAKLTMTHVISGDAAERKLTLSASIVKDELSGPLTITSTRGVTVTLSRGADGKLIGSIKAGEVEVGTVNGTQVNFKDGTTESLG